MALFRTLPTLTNDLLPRLMVEVCLVLAPDVNFFLNSRKQGLLCKRSLFFSFLFPQTEKWLGSSAEPIKLQRLLATLMQHSPVGRGSFPPYVTLSSWHTHPNDWAWFAVQLTKLVWPTCSKAQVICIRTVPYVFLWAKSNKGLLPDWLVGWLVCGCSLPAKERKEKKRNPGSNLLEDAPCINLGKRDTLAQSAVSLLHQWKR